ncbi:MAG: hypothetical protein K0B81_08570 [Candidatus Cloacimonetes bacterium]|nr:hypothetical protein [Candidatus Cloacimonadota bacterium]
MKNKLLFALLLCLLFLVASCEREIIKPEIYIPDNASRKPLFDRDLLMSDNSFYIGYQNGNIRPEQISFSWARSIDEDFLCYKLYRDNELIKTIANSNHNSFTDEELISNNYYYYMVTTLLKTGMNSFDTLTVKTASVQSPEVSFTIPQSDRVRLLWRDRSDIPGTFIIEKEDQFLAEVPQLPYEDPTFYYDFYDSDVVNFNVYNYSLYKAGVYDTTAVANISVLVEYVMVPPILTNAHQIMGQRQVQLLWEENCTAEDQFKIYRRLESEPVNAFAVVGTIDLPNQTSYIDEYNLEYGETYVYAVTAVNNYGDVPDETDISNTLTVTLYDETMVQIGSGTNSNEAGDAAPINIWYRSIRTQSVYTAAEINAAGFEGPAMLNSIAYFVTNVPNHPLPDFKIKISHTTATDASEHQQVGLEEVYYNSSFLPVVSQWNVLEFETPFLWDGVSSILIDTSFNLVPSYNPTGRQYIFYTDNGMRYTRSDTDNQENAYTSIIVNYKPQVMLSFQNPDTIANLGGLK